MAVLVVSKGRFSVLANSLCCHQKHSIMFDVKFILFGKPV